MEKINKNTTEHKLFETYTRNMLEAIPSHFNIQTDVKFDNDDFRNIIKDLKKRIEYIEKSGGRDRKHDWYDIIAFICGSMEHVKKVNEAKILLEKNNP